MITNRDTLGWLTELGQQLGAATDELATVEATAITSKVTYEKAYALAFLNEDGAVETKKQQALLATAEIRLQWQLDEAAVHAVVERIRTLRSRIEIGRSLNAAQRSEMQAAGLTY